MTHSLHRQGDRDSLAHDFCVLCIPQRGVNTRGAPDKARRFLDIVLKYQPVNYGVIACGNMYTHDLATIRGALDRSPAVFCVLASELAVESVLRDLKEEDLGLSVVVAALYDLVEAVCRRVGLTPHTTNHSLGVWGRTEKLPPVWVTEVTTMCGHAQISARLVETTADAVQSGALSAREAAIRLARPCICGFFNPARAEEMLQVEVGRHNGATASVVAGSDQERRGAAAI